MTFSSIITILPSLAVFHKQKNSNLNWVGLVVDEHPSRMINWLKGTCHCSYPGSIPKDMQSERLQQIRYNKGGIQVDRNFSWPKMCIYLYVPNVCHSVNPYGLQCVDRKTGFGQQKFRWIRDRQIIHDVSAYVICPKYFALKFRNPHRLSFAARCVFSRDLCFWFVHSCV